ncbi:hypothetical protein [Halobellus sp. EA9]|uniref:hypothetical protein n=1 Tax=Halobellus sp. EA9 TaxID=3421647 RepID=UPI003EB8EC81
MPRRRTIVRAAGCLAGTALFGIGAAASTQRDNTEAVDATTAIAQLEAISPAVEYVRNVEEVRGHLASSANLLEQGRRKDAALHAGHPSDYFGAILPPVRDTDPELATQLRAVLKTPANRVQSMAASAYRQYLNEEVLPMLSRAVETVVASDLRGSTSFSVRVMNALAGRIADEYSAAVPSAGTIDLVGEYWDGRGFLVRIEDRYAQAESALDGAGSEALSRLRTEMEDVVAAEDVRGTTLRFRMETAAAADLPSAAVDGRDGALAYARSVEEIRGHLHSSVALAGFGDEDATLHAGHAPDYVMSVLPPVQASNPDLASRLFEQLLAADERVASLSASEYEQFVTGDVFPLLEQAVSVAVPDEYTGSTSFDAAVFLALADRVADEYDAAVTDEEVIELYGEYWDARGFLKRMEERFAGFESALDSETRSEVSEELEVLRRELETARPPSDVAGSVEALHRMLDEAAES